MEIKHFSPLSVLEVGKGERLIEYAEYDHRYTQEKCVLCKIAQNMLLH